MIKTGAVCGVLGTFMVLYKQFHHFPPQHTAVVEHFAKSVAVNSQTAVIL